MADGIKGGVSLQPHPGENNTVVSERGLMANEEHLAMLRQGVDAWNSWRNERGAEAITKEEDEQRSDLAGTDLRAAFLCEADLSGADLRAANLDRADLRGASLEEAYLREASLGGADLSEANLRSADLRAANLTGVHFRRARLEDADLSGADLAHPGVLLRRKAQRGGPQRGNSLENRVRGR